MSSCSLLHRASVRLSHQIALQSGPRGGIVERRLFGALSRLRQPQHLALKLRGMLRFQFLHRKRVSSCRLLDLASMRLSHQIAL